MSERFFCKACLTEYSTEEQSPDPRYCKVCCHFLLIEAEEGARGASWVPVVPPDNCDTDAHGNLPNTSAVTDELLSQISAMAAQGLSCRAIEKELRADGVALSYRTIHRKLQGVML